MDAAREIRRIRGNGDPSACLILLRFHARKKGRPGERSAFFLFHRAYVRVTVLSFFDTRLRQTGAAGGQRRDEKKERERGRDEGRVEREGSEEERKKIGWR